METNPATLETPVDLTAVQTEAAAPAASEPAPEKKTEAKPKKEKKVAAKSEKTPKKETKPKKEAKAPKKEAKAPKKELKAARKGNGRTAGTKAQTQVPLSVMNDIKKLAKADDTRVADATRKVLYAGLKKLGIAVPE